MTYPPQSPNPQPQYAAPVGGVAGPGEPFDGATTPDDLTRPLYGASFGQAIKRFFKNYANFKGRASRSEYWWTMLFTFLLELVPLVLIMIGAFSVAGSAISGSTTDVYGETTLTPEAATAAGGGVAVAIVGYILLVIIGLAILIPTLAINWRRLHDANFAGPFWFLSLTSVGGIIVLVFTLLPPKPEGRRFDAR